MTDTNLKQFTSLENALSSLFGEGVSILKSRRVSGGDINDAYELMLTNGTSFISEAAGLAAIARTNAIGTPRLLCIGTDDGKSGYSFLLMDFIERTGQIRNYWEIFARQLAAMHQADAANFVAGGMFGFLEDNYIGARKQMNTAHESWIDFFRDCRLKPQFADAAPYFDSTDQNRVSRLLDYLDTFLVEQKHRSFSADFHGFFTMFIKARLPCSQATKNAATSITSTIC